MKKIMVDGDKYEFFKVPEESKIYVTRHGESYLVITKGCDAIVYLIEENKKLKREVEVMQHNQGMQAYN